MGLSTGPVTSILREAVMQLQWAARGRGSGATTDVKSFRPVRLPPAPWRSQSLGRAAVEFVRPHPHPMAMRNPKCKSKEQNSFVMLFTLYVD